MRKRPQGFDWYGNLGVLALVAGGAYLYSQGYFGASDASQPNHPPNSHAPLEFVARTPEEVLRFVNEKKVAQPGGMEFWKIDLAKFSSSVGHPLAHPISVMVPCSEASSFKGWYLRSPKRQKFIDSLETEWSEKNRTAWPIVIQAPKNEVGIEWVVGYGEKSSFRTVVENSHSESDFRNETVERPYGNQPEVSDEKSELAAAAAVAGIHLIGWWVGEQLKPDQVSVQGYHRADGTYVRPHSRAFPDRSGR